MSKPKELVTLTAEEGRIIATVTEGDGHSILPAEEFIKAGVNEAFVRSVEQVYKSSKSDPKGMIFTDEGLVGSLKGVYTLDILRAAVSKLNLSSDAGAYFGRGRQARAYVEALMK